MMVEGCGGESATKSLDKDELKQLLVRSWMTHDAMWFRHCVEACGIEQTNLINAAAVRSMAAIEIRRLRRALAPGKIRSMGALRELVEAAWQLNRADFMDFALSYPAPNRMRWEVRRCFAFDGATRVGVADRYQCGIFPRVETWFDGLRVKYTVTPAVEGCMMQTDGRCAREYTLTFDGK
jgi:hypothetical protein